MSAARDGDLGVGPLVRRAHHAVHLAHVAEGLLLGLGAALLAAAAGVQAGVDAVDLWSIALLAGIPMGLAWRCEVRSSHGRLVRRIDRDLHLGGALVVAWEVECEGRSGALGHVIATQLRRRLRLPLVLRAALPNSAGLLAAPIAGAALLLVALESRPEPPDPMGSIAQVLGGVTAGLEDAEPSSGRALAEGDLSLEDRAELQRLTANARQLTWEAERLGDDPHKRDELREGVADLARELEEFAERVAGHAELDGRLEQTLAMADAAERATTAGTAGPDPGRSTTDLVAGAPGGSGAGGGAAAVPEQDPGEGGLANGGPQGTIVAPHGQVSGPQGPDSAPLPGPEGRAAAGVSLGPWWPERHAGVVRRYVERRRDEDPGSSE